MLFLELGLWKSKVFLVMGFFFLYIFGPFIVGGERGRIDEFCGEIVIGIWEGMKCR